MLTALGVMIATFAILVGLAAIWGYAGLKDHLHDIAEKKVDVAMQEALMKYPDAAVMLKTLERLREQADFIDQVRNQVVTAPEPKILATASKSDVQEEVPETPLESVDQQVTPIAKYPGEEDVDASDDGKTSG